MREHKLNRNDGSKIGHLALRAPDEAPGGEQDDREQCIEDDIGGEREQLRPKQTLRVSRLCPGKSDEKDAGREYSHNRFQPAAAVRHMMAGPQRHRPKGSGRWRRTGLPTTRRRDKDMVRSIDAWNLTAADIEEGHLIIAEIDKTNDPMQRLRLATEFHSVLYARANRPFFLEQVNRARNHLNRYWRLAWGDRRFPISTQKEHQQILDLCVAGDRSGLMALIEQHIMTSGDFVLQYLQKKGKLIGTLASQQSLSLALATSESRQQRPLLQPRRRQAETLPLRM